jgi:hypothetical protein
MNIIKNTRAEVPIVILVLGVLLLCIIIAVAEVKRDDNPGKINDVSSIESCLSLIEQYHFYENMHYDREKIESLPLFKDSIDSQGNLICKSQSMEIRYSLNNVE